MATVVVTVPGKIILSGEHAVVYGYPSLVMAVDRSLKLSAEFDESAIDKKFFQRLLNTFDRQSVFDIINQLNLPESNTRISMESTIPVGCGMGSSAALSAGISALVLFFAGKRTTRDKINELAYLLEKQIHYNPSGVDNSIVVYGGCLKFQRNGEQKMMSQVDIVQQMPAFFLINTGKPQESTGDIVQKVRERRERSPQKIEQALKKIGMVTEELLQFLEGNSEHDFPKLMKRNEALLEDIGVVSASTRKLIRSIEQIGGRAKVSGAGGIAGASGIVIVYHEDRQKLIDFLDSLHIEHMIVEMNKKGIEIYHE